MAAPNECINVHVGQAGIQMGRSCWELFCLEQGVAETGSGREASTGDKTPRAWPSFFWETPEGRHLPRAVFTDLDPTAKGLVTSSPYSDIFNQIDSQAVGSQSDTAGVYARGYYTAGKDHLEAAVEAVRGQAERAPNLKGFLVYRALGGGTGAGFGSLLMERLTGDYPKVPLLEVVVYPHHGLSPYFVEPYNAVLSTHTGLEYTNVACSFMLDNAALYEVCRTKLDIERPGYRDINSLVSNIVSSVTLSLRHPEDSLVSFGDEKVDMTPLPRVHFPLISFSPLTSPSDHHHSQPTVGDLTKELMNPDSVMVQCDVTKGKSIAYSVLYRGADVTTTDVNQAMKELRSNLMECADWCPGGNKVSVHGQPLVAPPGSAMGSPKRSATLIANSTAVVEAWSRLTDKFDLLFSRRAFLHWFLGEGMEEAEFTEAREDLAVLEQDYNEVAAIDSGTMDENGEPREL